MQGTEGYQASKHAKLEATSQPLGGGGEKRGEKVKKTNRKKMGTKSSTASRRSDDNDYDHLITLRFNSTCHLLFSCFRGFFFSRFLSFFFSSSPPAFPLFFLFYFSFLLFPSMVTCIQLYDYVRYYPQRRGKGSAITQSGWERGRGEGTRGGRDEAKPNNDLCVETWECPVT